MRRLGWHLCGPHKSIDVIVGEGYSGNSTLVLTLISTLGSAGARLLEIKMPPVAGLTELVGQENGRRGNLLLLASDWPEGLDALSDGVKNRLGWALRIPGSMVDTGIDRDLLTEADARECLLLQLVRGAQASLEQWEAISGSYGGDPGQIAATADTRRFALEAQMAGANPTQRILYAAIRFTGKTEDSMTCSEVNAAIRPVGETPPPRHVSGRAITQIWPRLLCAKIGDERAIRGIVAKETE